MIKFEIQGPGEPSPGSRRYNMAIRKKVIVVSDSHGRNHNLWRVLEKEKPYDMLIHCGDYQGNESELFNHAGCDVHIVAGNCDYYSDFPSDKIIQLGSHKVLITHGHKYRLYAGYQNLYYSALEKEADYVIFGHLHKPIIDGYGGVTMLNPGSITEPRQEDGIATYMTLLLMDDGSVDVKINKI